jgi:hypothetical protein
MSSRRFPWFSAACFAIAIAVFAISFGDRRVFSTRGSGMEGGWQIFTRGGRVVASRSNLLSSFISRPAVPTWRNLGGFSIESRRFSRGGMVGGTLMSQHVAMPTYPLPVVFALLLAWRIQRWRCATIPGHCTHCGYDLRASPQRCPECGKAAV